MTDDELHDQMRKARVSLPFPADFQREIWGRIEAAESGASHFCLASFWEGMMFRIARPVPAVALAVLMGGGGYLAARMVGEGNVRQQAESAYLRSVSPFAAAQLEAGP